MKKYLLLVESKESPGSGTQSSDSPTRILGVFLGGNFCIFAYKGLIITGSGGTFLSMLSLKSFIYCFIFFFFSKTYFWNLRSSQLASSIPGDSS